MKRIIVSAPGKLNLLGEHIVVHSRPAIIVAVDKRCFVEIAPRNDQKIKITSKNYKKTIITSFAEISSKFQKAEMDYATYTRTNDIELLKSITKNPLDYPLLIIGQFINYFELSSVDGFELVIDSQIPVGAGMGSSGALAVSMIGALCLFTGQDFEKEEINKIAYLCEQKKHGKPSGGDNSTSCFGGLVWFKRDAYSGKAKIKPLEISIPKKITKNFYVVNSGTPKETTGEMVSRVKDLLKEQPAATNKIFDEQAILVKKLSAALKKGNGNDVLNTIKQGEGNLESLGVVSKFSQKIIRDIENSGGAAKINGGGGIKKGTGMLLIYHNNLKSLQKVLKFNNLKSSQMVLGVEGLRIENA